MRPRPFLISRKSSNPANDDQRQLQPQAWPRSRRFSSAWANQDKAWSRGEAEHAEIADEAASRAGPERRDVSRVTSPSVETAVGQSGVEGESERERKREGSGGEVKPKVDVSERGQAGGGASARAGDGSDYVDEALVQAEDEDKATVFLVFLILTAAISGFLFGFDTALIGNAVPIIGNDLGHPLSSSEIEIITALLTVGAIFGSGILGSFADKLGRRAALGIADFFFTAGAVIVASSYSVPQMIVGRVVLGVGVGGAAVIGPLYISELAPTSYRGRCIGVNAFFIPLGQVVAAGLGAGLQNTAHGWRILFALGVIPSIIQLSLMHWLPESPRIAILRGNREAALDTFSRIYPIATEEQLQLKLQLAESFVKATTKLQRELPFVERNKRLWTHKPYRRAIVCIAGVQMFAQLTAFNTLLYYSGTLFGLLGLRNSALAGLVPASLNAFFVFVGMCIVDKVGRRRLFVWLTPVMIAGLVWISVAFHFLVRETDNVLVEGYPYDQTIAGVVIGGIVLFTMGYGLTYSCLCWYQSEFLALEIRAAGSAIGAVACWIANLVVSVAYLTQLEQLTPSGTYALYVGFCVCGYVFVLFCYPEPKGLSVDEVASLFVDGFGIAKSREMRAGKEQVAKQRQSCA